MKLLLIQPAPFTGKHDNSFHLLNYLARKNYFTVPPISLGILAALTPSSWDVRIIQEPHQQVHFDEAADLVGITANTSNVLRGYRIADEFRLRGVAVIMGGIHPTVRVDEALEHCDSVCIGEGELVWGDVLEDLQHKRLRKKYKAETYFNMQEYVPPRRDLMTSSNSLFYSAATLETSRGCPYNCDFCSVSISHGNRIRYRSPEGVVEEISGIGRKKFFFVDNNIVADHRKAKELFRSLIPLKIKWSGQATISVADDPQLLKYAVDSGCHGLLIGIENITDEGLNKYKKSKKDFQTLKASVRILNEHGIAILAHMVFGNDFDTRDSIVETLDRLCELDVASATLGIMVPYPGTKLAEDLEKENRILTKNWNLYDIHHLVFQPKNFTPEEFIEDIQRLRNQYFTMGKMLSRTIKCRKPVILGFNLSSKSHNRVGLAI
jgi:radical SAM superfamily enzyme YgiQ (UPF0313 family)